MSEPSRAKSGRRNRRSASQIFIGVMIVLAVAASVLSVFADTVQWLRVGVLCAVWAALIGAFAMTRYRRDSAQDQAKVKDLQTVYELQLAREISARREYELGVENRVRSQVRIEADELTALRHELAALRGHLEVLFDGNLPTERTALRAESTRMQEIGGRAYGSYQTGPSGLYVPGRQNTTGLSTPYDEPVTAETSVVYPGGVPEEPYNPEPYVEPVAYDEPETQPVAEEEPLPTPPVRRDYEPFRPSTPTPTEAADVEPARRNRRRPDPEDAGVEGAHSSGRSVAEIMASLQSGDTEDDPNRRRRRRDQ